MLSVNAAVAPQSHGDDGGNGGGEDVNEVVADQDDANQAIRSVKQVVHAHGSTVFAFHHVSQTVAVKGHHPGFRAGKESRHQDKDAQNAE